MRMLVFGAVGHPRPGRSVNLRSLAALGLIISLAVAVVSSQSGPAEATLSTDDVLALLRGAATAINSGSLSVSVVDRGGRILGGERIPRHRLEQSRRAHSSGPTSGADP